MSTIIDSYYESPSDTHYTIVASGGSHAAGQIFTGNGYIAKQAEFVMLKIGVASGPMVAEIYATTGTPPSAIPTGSPLSTSDSIDASTLGTSDSLVTFNFSTPMTTTNGGQYAVVVDVSGITGAVRIGQNTSAPTDDGNRVDYNDLFGTGWESLSGADAYFYVLGDPSSIAWTQPASDSVSSNDMSLRSIGKEPGDMSSVADALHFIVVKSLSDSTMTTESSLRKVVKPLSDSVTGSESNVHQVHKDLADSVNTADASSSLSVYKRSPSDSVTTSDSIVTTIPSLKHFADSVTTSDSISKKIVRASTDSVTTSDTSSKLNVYKRVFADSVTVLESTEKPSKDPFTDSVTVLELVSKNIVKHFADSVTTIDHFSAGRHIDETLTVLDRVAIFLSGKPMVVPTADWIVIPVIGAQGQSPNVGFDTDIHVGATTDLNNRPLVGL